MKSFNLRALVILFFLRGVCIIAFGALGVEGVYNVKDFGASGDGKTDDTAAFQKALDKAGESPGAVVHAPIGNYLVEKRLVIPDHVTLEGVWRIPTAWTQHKGSTLLAVADAGKPEAEPFITLKTNSTIKGITIFYPEQKETNPPTPYPWTIASGGADNCSIVDCLLVNPYKAVDFGTRVAGRHYIRNLYGQPLYRGLFIDQCYDVGRVENVHFWPFWVHGDDHPISKFMREEAEAFVIGRTDWEYMNGCFTILYKVGFRFTSFKNGPGNVLLNTCGADVGPIAVVVDDCQHHAGVSFSNSQMYGDIIVKGTNSGPVKFTGCGLFGSTDGGRGVTHAKIDGAGQVSLTNCHLKTIDPKNKARCMIRTDGGGLSVIGCDFMDPDKEHIFLGKDVQSAVVMGNRFRGRMKITDESVLNVSITGNVDDSREEEPGAMVIDNGNDEPGFETQGAWKRAFLGGDYMGDQLWCAMGKGESRAEWKAKIPREGLYKVYVWYGADLNDDHATNAPFTVHFSGGEKELRVNLEKNKYTWNLLGEFPFKKNEVAKVVLTNDADGFVVADAVKFLLVKALD